MARRNSSPAVPIPSPHEFMGALKRSGSLGQRPPLLGRALSFSNPFAKKIARTPSPRNSPVLVSPTTLVSDRTDELPDLSDGSTALSDSRPSTPPSPCFYPADKPIAPHRLPCAEYETWIRATELRQFKFSAGITRVHRYPANEVPYPQSYARVARQSEHHQFCLLKELAGGSPTFSDKTFQPKRVLDIGAGVGHWAAFAAETWPDCTVTAFDIVNMSYDLVAEPAVMDRIVWIEGNFLEDWDKWEQLQDDAFDFVRLAGWEMSVPYDKLEALVHQIKRVLTPNGKLEVVCDEPTYAHAESTLSATQTYQRNNSFDNCRSYFDSDSEDEATPVKPKISRRTYSKRSSGSSASSSHYAKSARHSSSSSSTQYEDDDTLRNSTSATPWDDTDTLCSTASSRKRDVLRAEMCESYDIQTQSTLAMSNNVESWFGAMLRERLRLPIDPRGGTKPIDVHNEIKQTLWTILEDVFGGGRVVPLPPFKVVVPTKETPVEPARPPMRARMTRTNSHERPQVFRSDRLKRSASYLHHKSHDHAGDAGIRESLMSPLLKQAHVHTTQQRLSVDYSEKSPSVKSSKAMKTLGIPASKAAPYQPQGFVIMPKALFVPCSPEALEAHACKHMDTIIECKHALNDFARTHGYDGQTFNEIMPGYERFKRTRMNWPLDYPSLKMICEEPISPTSATDPHHVHSSWWPWAKPTNSSTPASYEDAIHIRTIEVFQAIKPGTSLGAGDIYIPTPTADKDVRAVRNTHELTGFV